MIIFKDIATIKKQLAKMVQEGKSIGFVPTMGALHKGHLSLLNQAKQQSDITVVSIFVNPTQFNDPKDFEKYPLTLDADILQLEKSGCDLLFLPAVETMYPDGFYNSNKYELGFIETILDGAFRKGHFQGVCQIVEKLLKIVNPHKLFLGQKDYQQCMVIKKLVDLLAFNTNIIICETKREPSGLAMSSRNLRLNKEDLEKSSIIYNTLKYIKKNIKPGNLTQLKEEAIRILSTNGITVDYIEIATAENLNAVEVWDGKTKLVVLVAAMISNIRLIDNLLL